MELLLSNISPAKLSKSNSSEKWMDCLSDSAQIRIATGFISSNSIIELKKIVEENNRPYVDLLIGMHYFDKFTKQQYDAIKSLNNLLLESQLGNIYLSTALRFHGKMYSFLDNQKRCFGAMIGSSNLSSIVGKTSNIYEADYFFDSSQDTTNIDNAINKLISQIGTNFNEIPEITDFEENNDILENHYNVKKVTNEEYAKVYSSRTLVQFEIPLKVTPKSNLNCFFGKGRDNNRGFILPRSWYEVEIIVSNKITKQPNYPCNRKFEVFTDDHFSFECCTNGDYSKNFRSANDLEILGKWIKGRMEKMGCLKVGEPITDEVLSRFGKNKIRLIGTSNSDVWLLELI